MLTFLSPSPAPSFDYADMPSPLGESENTITVLLRPAQGRGAPIRWESPDGGVGGQGHSGEAPALTQSPHTGQLTLVLPQPPILSSVRLERMFCGHGRQNACCHAPRRPWASGGDYLELSGQCPAWRGDCPGFFLPSNTFEK